MKVLLVNPPIRNYTPPVNYPYGLSLIAAVLEKNFIEFDVLDINGLRFSKKDVLNYLSNNSYDIIGIGGLITIYSYIKWFANQSRKILPKAKLVVGGGVATWNPEFILRHIKVDLVVVGEGEKTFSDIVKNYNFNDMNGGQPFSGAAYIDKEGRYIFKPRSLIKNLDELPLPAWHKFPMDTYVSNNKYSNPNVNLQRGIQVYFTRGCHMNCSFCFHIFGKGIRFRKLENVIEEIMILKKNYVPDHIDFLDECFTFNKKHVMKFCEIYKDSGINLPFRVCGGRLDTIDKETASALLQAGCIHHGVGIESGSPRILKNMHKKITPEKMSKSINMFRDIGLNFSPTFIHGMTGENEVTVKESIAFYNSLGLKNVHPFFIQPYPGSPIWTDDIEKKVMRKYKSLERYIETLGDALKFIINISEVSDRKLLALHRKIKIETSGMNGFSYFVSQQKRRISKVRDNGLFWLIGKLKTKLFRKLKLIK